MNLNQFEGVRGGWEEEGFCEGSTEIRDCERYLPWWGSRLRGGD